MASVLEDYIGVDSKGKPYVISEFFEGKHPAQFTWMVGTMYVCAMSHLEEGIDIHGTAYDEGLAEAVGVAFQMAQDAARTKASIESAGEVYQLPDSEAADYFEKWMMQGMKILSDSHKRLGVDLDRRYQVGMYNANVQLKPAMQNTITLEDEEALSAGVSLSAD